MEERNTIKMSKVTLERIAKIIAIVFFSCFFIFFIVNGIYETEMLKGPTKQIPGVLIEIREASSKSRNKALVKYSVNGKEYDFYSDEYYLDMNVGVSVLVEYSIKDPSVAFVAKKNINLISN